MVLAPDVFDTRTVPPDRFLELLNDAYSSDRFAVTPNASINKPMELKRVRWILKNVVISHTYSRHHLGKIHHKGPGEFVYIIKYISGVARAWFDGPDYLAREGDIIIALSVNGTVFKVRDLMSLAVTLPLDVLGIDRTLLAIPKLIPAGSLENRILSSAMETWCGELPGMRRMEAGLLEASAIGLVESLLQHGADAATRNTDAARARGEAVRRFIEAELARPDLGVDLISRTFNISRTTIYRDFEEDGGIAGFVRRRRLQIALNALASGPPNRGRIQKVAQDVGFTDPFHFSKAFRTHFGFSPSDVLSLAEISENGA